MHFLTRVEKLLDSPPAEKALVMRELRSHYFEAKEELMASGMDSPSAEQEAECRLGEPEDVAARMGPVYNVAGWKSALIGLIPYFIAILASPRIIPVKIFGANIMYYIVSVLLGLIVAGTIREFALGKRPIWLTTWLAASVAAPTSVIMMFGGISDYRWITMFHTAIPSIICLFLVYRSKSKWQTPALVCIIISILCEIMNLNMQLHANNISSLIYILSSLFPFVLMIFIALILFMENRYSNAIQASLFLFAIFTIHINRPDTYTYPGFYFYIHALSIFTCAGAWLLCVRSPLKFTKYCAIAGGLILSGFWTAMPGISYRVSSSELSQHYTMIESIALDILSVLPSGLISIMIVFTPIIIERRRNKQNLQAVH